MKARVYPQLKGGVACVTQSGWRGLFTRGWLASGLGALDLQCTQCMLLLDGLLRTPTSTVIGYKKRNNFTA
jgi:hypothetical protein